MVDDERGRLDLHHGHLVRYPVSAAGERAQQPGVVAILPHEDVRGPSPPFELPLDQAERSFGVRGNPDEPGPIEEVLVELAGEQHVGVIVEPSHLRPPRPPGDFVQLVGSAIIGGDQRGSHRVCSRLSSATRSRVRLDSGPFRCVRPLSAAS